MKIWIMKPKKIFFQIEKRLKEIKRSGQLLLALPVIKQLIEQNFADIRDPFPSKQN